MSSSSSSWLKSHQCSYNGNMMHWSSSSSSSFTMTLLSFIFLSPCPQRILFSSVNLLFLLTLFFPFLKNLFSRSNVANNSPPSSLHKPLIATEPTRTVKVTIWFHLSLAAAALLAVTYTVVSVLGLCSPGSGTEWDVIEVLSRLLQAIAYIAVLFLLADEKKSTAVSHPTSLRLYWVVNFALVALFSASGIARFLEDGGGDDYDTRTDDVASLVSLPVSAFLFGVAVHGSSGISIVTHVVSRGSSSSSGMAAVSEYAKASLLSKGMWLWINPVLTKGYKSVIKMDDVPLLPPDLTAERMTDLFEKKWPKEDGNRPRKNPVLMTLIRCFWREILFTGFLAIVRLVVVYVGPLLIQSFIDYSSGDRGSVYEGCYLILVLLMAKTVEVFSSHHLNFESRKLGMLMRSALISSIYKKGLRLSCSSRQAHGIGRIVNYMAMDCQQVADMMLQVHPIWLMPLQVGVALALLYGHLGVATMAALVALVAVLFFTLWITKKNNSFMYKVMMNRDSRMKATNELLSNMRVIKFQAWEDYFHERILDARRMEYGWLSKFMYSVSTNLIILGSVPILITALTFGVAIAFGVSLDAGTVFTATTIFKILQEPVRAFPQALTTMSQAMVSLGRLDRYLTSRESDDHTIERRESHDGTIAVEITGGTFSYDDDGGEEVLKDVILSVKKGELAAVVGTVGSGKSSLLASILGELHKVSGKVRVCGTTAYVAQTSWIQNATIEKNILFGSPMERERYEEVIRICCLEKDLEAMDHGDQTEIGERGINLSGGQKQRIQLARAVYQDCDIYLLDDVFSAVDAQTGSEIFKRCVRGALKDKTVILVTHQVDFLHNADLILVMRDRKIVQSGRYEELLESGLDFGALVAAHETSMELVEMKNSVSSNGVSQTEKSARASSRDGATNGEAKSLDGPKSKKSNAKLIEEEERETGQVSLKIYKHYSTETYGWFGVAAVILTSVLWQASQMASDFWLAFETSANHVFTPNLFITIYSIIAVITSVLMLIRTYFITFLGLKTGQSFFHQIVLSILHAPMSFFDTTPSGRILSRASTDQSNIDITIPMFFSMTILMYFMILGIVVMMCFNAWPTTFFIIPLAWLNWWYQRYYLASSRDLTRLDSISKAPVIHHFSETVSGVMTICCFRKQDSFIQENIDRVNANSRMVFYNDGANEWLGFRLELIGSFFLCISTIFMVFLPSTVIQPENVGLALSYGLPFNILLFSTVFLGCTVENKMVSVERIKQFISIPSEAAWRIRETLPSPNWPNHGNVIVNNLQVRYRPNTPLVLKGITFSIRGGEKIGVVGRTGSGKSTLIQVFFRLVEPSGGKIIIDGLDISKLGLHDLRSRFAIIPQDPVLFQGTVRSNMDPIGLYSDEEIWKSLERCQMKDVVAAKPEKLYAAVSDGGDNWSVGQRQLLCLGRVMLKNSRILFMDEATASVDSQTDALIQNIIREDFSSCTIITIAHRIPTVIDCDRVLVIDSGYAKEYDTPSKLLESASLFGALVQEYANRSAS